MHILLVYLVCVIVGQAISVGIGLLLDSYSQNIALAAFLIIYYAMYWVAWRVALLIVRPVAGPSSRDRPTTRAARADGCALAAGAGGR